MILGKDKAKISQIIDGTAMMSTLAEINALYRPGPIGAGLIEKYIAIKTGQFSEKTRLTEEELIIKGILKGAFGEAHSGLCVFQEDVMMICQDGAGFTLTEADDIRKAMGKKKLKELLPYKEQFIKNWKFSGSAEKIWESLLGFAEYAFNKSHSVAYAVIGYDTAKIWTYGPQKYLEYTFNYDTNKRYGLAVEKCKELGLKFSFPSINNMADEYITVTDKMVTVPGSAKRNYDSYVEFLFDVENGDVFNLIYKGVCDSITKDRYALSELVSTCLATAKKGAMYMEPSGEKFTTLTQILDGLILVGGVVSYKREHDGIHVLMKRMRGESNKIIFHKNESNYCKLNICTYDRKYFGKVRDGIISDMPYINISGITTTIEGMVNTLSERGKTDKEIYYAIKDKLQDYMREYFSNKHKRIYEDVYAIFTDFRSYERSTKIDLSFNDKDDIFYVSGENRKIVEKLGKNTLVKLKMEYSPFIKKANNTFVYDFDILEIEEVKEV